MLTCGGALAVLCAAALVGWGAEAQAAIPQGNTLLNGDGETGAAVNDETTQVCPQGWTCTPTQPDMTLIRYGTTTFPSVAESGRIGGGTNLFAGGPGNVVSSASQVVTLGDQPEFDTPTVKATFSGCLGGFQDQVDLGRLELRFFTEENPDIGIPFSVDGPTAAARGNKTTLLPVSRAVTVPPTTNSFRLTLTFAGETGGYNTGFADNLSVTFGPSSGPDPPASPCSVPPGGGPPGGGPGSGPGPGGGSGGGGEAVKLLSFGTAVVGADGKARVRVTCNTTQLRTCKGTLSAWLVRASRTSKKLLTLGRARFSVPSLKTRTVTLALRRSALKKVRKLSKRDLAARRLKLRATTKVGITKLTQTSLLGLKLRG